MRQFDPFKAVTRRELGIHYVSPLICQLAVPSSGSGSSESSVIEIQPVTRRAGPASIEVTKASANSASISWSELSYAYSYIIYRSTNPEGPWIQVAANVFHPPHVDTDIAPGTYYFKVTAIERNAGETLPSPISSALLI